MRQARLKTRNGKRTTGNRTPLAEGIVQLRSNGQRDWASLTDENLIGYAKRYIKEKGISGRGELEKTDNGLYKVLRKRGLVDKVGFEEKRRAWKEVENKELIKHVKRFMREKGIRGRSELEKADGGLYNTLRKRGLLDRVEFEEKKRSWKEMGDEEIIEYAKTFMKENGIGVRHKLNIADPGLYEALRKRRLLDDVGFEEKRRPWEKMEDTKIIEYAKTFMKENGIKRRNDLEKANCGLYHVLLKKGLSHQVGFEEKRRRPRPWHKMKDEEVIKYATRFMKENGISRRLELWKADRGLYQVLKKRGLIDRVEFDKKLRHWSEMEDEKLVELARKFMNEKGITGRTELSKADSGLYSVLWKRGLLSNIGFEWKHRPWISMSDEEFINHVKGYMKQKGIRGRHELEKADCGLYHVLRKRKLLDLVFSDIERSKQRAFRKQLLLGLSQAADAMQQFGERG